MSKIRMNEAVRGITKVFSNAIPSSSGYGRMCGKVPCPGGNFPLDTPMSFEERMKKYVDGKIPGCGKIVYTAPKKART